MPRFKGDNAPGCHLHRLAPCSPVTPRIIATRFRPKRGWRCWGRPALLSHATGTEQCHCTVTAVGCALTQRHRGAYARTLPAATLNGATCCYTYFCFVHAPRPSTYCPFTPAQSLRLPPAQSHTFAGYSSRAATSTSACVTPLHSSTAVDADSFSALHGRNHRWLVQRNTAACLHPYYLSFAPSLAPL
jgi:hypothetical protein